jgi:hypothetical protein
MISSTNFPIAYHLGLIYLVSTSELELSTLQQQGVGGLDLLETSTILSKLSLVSCNFLLVSLKSWRTFLMATDTYF